MAIDSEFGHRPLPHCAGETGTDTIMWIRRSRLRKGIDPPKPQRALL